MQGTDLDFETRFETWLELRLLDGKLICQTEVLRCLEAYDPPPAVLDKLLLFEDWEGQRRRITSLSDIDHLLPPSKRVEQATKQPRDWAELLAFCHDLGVVLFPTIRLSSYTALGVDLVAIAPRVERGVLKFVAVRIDLELENRPIVNVEWDLLTLQHRATIIMSLEDLESGRRQWAFVIQ